MKTKIRKHHKGSSIRKVRFTKDGRMVTIAKTAKVHDLISNQTTHTLRREDGNSTKLYSVRPFGSNIVAAGDDDGGIFLWDLRTPENTIFSSCDCEQYISDIDGKYESRKLIVCTSGEGTLTAYDMRAKKMLEPQSELFEAGFQCVKLIEANKKVVIGGEDGAIYVFNQNEWAHTSGKFAISSDVQNRGKCSIDCLDILPDNSTFVVGCSDGKMRSLTLWPHEILTEKVFCKRSSIESLHVRPSAISSQIVLTGEDYLNIINFKEREADDDAELEITQTDETLSESSKTASAVGAISKEGTSTERASENKNENENATGKAQKRLKPSNEDYLDIFK